MKALRRAADVCFVVGAVGLVLDGADGGLVSAVGLTLLVLGALGEVAFTAAYVLRRLRTR